MYKLTNIDKVTIPDIDANIGNSNPQYHLLRTIFITYPLNMYYSYLRQTSPSAKDW